jgi:hypothetical protein
MRHPSQNVNFDVYETELEFGKSAPLEQARMRRFRLSRGKEKTSPRFDLRAGSADKGNVSRPLGFGPLRIILSPEGKSRDVALDMAV